MTPPARSGIPDRARAPSNPRPCLSCHPCGLCRPSGRPGTARPGFGPGHLSSSAVPTDTTHHVAATDRPKRSSQARTHTDVPCPPSKGDARRAARRLWPGTTISNAAVVNQNASLSTVLVAQPITKLIAVHAATQIARADENAARAQLDKGTRDLLSGLAQAYYGLSGLRRIRTALELQFQVLEQAVAAKPLPELRGALLEARPGLVQA